MSGQQSPVAPESSRSEAVDESTSEAKPYTLRDGVQIWKDITAQTGFNSYKAYVEAHGEYRADIRLLRHWMTQASHEDRYNRCYIVDVSTHEDWPPKMSTRCHSASGFELLAALRQPPEHVRVQVVLWMTKDAMSFELVDILGLGLRIDPQFFLAAIERLDAPQQLEHFHDAIDTRPLRPSHIVIDRLVATFVRHHPTDKPATPPIILIAGDLDLTWDFMCVANQNISKPPPFTLPNYPIQKDLGTIYPSDLTWLNIYKEAFSRLAENNHGIARFTVTAAIIVGILMPLLHMNSLKIRTYSINLRRTFLVLQAMLDKKEVNREAVDHKTSILHHERFKLRRSVEDSDNGMSHFERCISAEDANYLPEDSAWLKVKQETGQIHDEARRLDTEIREYLQLVVGDLSLEESRKSIELSNNQIILSNNQISEAKRG